ncbi:MAG: RHS repeat-associated core domain-containing protein, partial [Planctomycetota bacterium]|nr:RHS repeat-associated core domain-containing protein [Planctomycetota bacterium]
MTWLMDERGFITRFKYDIATEGMTQRIDDVDTAQTSDEPAGWETPTGGGLHLITDFTNDVQGRTIETLGPIHTIDLSGTATSIRRASWNVYQDAAFENWAGQGYQKTSDSSYTLINPVQIAKMDAAGKVLEQISSTRGSSTTSSGKLAATDTFAQSSYVRWQTTQYTDCCFAASQRAYKLIPTSGAGTSGTNYDETDFGYDVMKRRNRTVSPGGTITRTVFNSRGLATGIWVGTNDNGASATDPSGGGAAGNNMVQVSGVEYDSNVAGGDSNVTKQIAYVDSNSANNRETSFVYDFRNRRTATDGEIDFYEQVIYDNLDRVLRTDRRNTTSAGNLIARAETRFDDRGRVYQSVRYGVDPTSGVVGYGLTDNTWFDASGNVIKSQP